MKDPRVLRLRIETSSLNDSVFSVQRVESGSSDMMTRLVSVKVWAGAIVLLGMSAGVGAQQPAVQGTTTPQTPPQNITPSGLQMQTVESYVVGKAKPPEIP